MDAKKRILTPQSRIIPDSVLDDLCSRFLLNIPSKEKNDMIRLCFQIELAHWFYLDFYRPEDQSLPDCRIYEFAKLIFEKYDFLLKPPDADVDEVITKWREYKRSVPTYGAIVLDETMEHVLLVQGYVVKSSWGFPKGKVNKDEAAEDCAIREVLEETGFDIKPYLKPTEFEKVTLNEQATTLYYVVGVPRMTKFTPKTRGEIKSVEWFNLDDLPCHKKDFTPKLNLSLGPNNFFMVIPFVSKIRKWIMKQKKGQSSTTKTSSKTATPVKKTASANQKIEGMTKAQFEQASLRSTPPNFKAEDLKRQRQYFSKENNKNLQQILRIQRGESSPHSERRTQRNRSNSPHHYLSSPSGGHSYSASRGRGRILQSESMPEAWKNFKFNREALEKAINDFLPPGMK